MELDKNKLMATAINQLNLAEQPQQNFSIEDLKKLVEKEQESNKIRELANIGSAMAEGMTGARQGSRLELDDSAKNALQSLLKSKQSGALTPKDKLYGASKLADIIRKDQQFDVSAGQRDKSLQQTQKKIEQVSERAAEKLGKLKTLENQLNEVKNLKKNVNTGVFTNLYNNLAGTFVSGEIPSKERNKLKSLTGSVLAEYIKSISGAAVTNEEAARLLAVVPNMNDDDKIFNDKLDQFQKILNSSKEEKIKAIQDTGRDVSKFRNTGIMPTLKDLKEAGVKETEYIQDPKIKNWADKYGKTYEEAEKILRSRGYGR